MVLANCTRPDKPCTIIHCGHVQWSVDISVIIIVIELFCDKILNCSFIVCFNTAIIMFTGSDTSLRGQDLWQRIQISSM